MSIDIEKLRALALAATAGPWEHRFVDGDGTSGAICHEHGWVADDFTDQSFKDTAFMAAANPAAVLELIADNERLQKSRIPAGLYRELVALRELRDQTKKYVDSYLLDEVESAELCVSEDQHLCAAELSECLMDAFEAHWDSCMAKESGQ